MTISLIGRIKFGLGVELMKVSVKHRTALTVYWGHDIKVSRDVGSDKSVGKNVKTLGANGIDTKTIAKGEVGIKKVVDGAGRQRLEVFILVVNGSGMGRRQGYTRRESGR
jgi:hypothetical protein